MYKFKTYLAEYTCTRYYLKEATGEIVEEERTGTFIKYEANTKIWKVLRSIALIALLLSVILSPVLAIPAQSNLIPTIYGFIPLVTAIFFTWLFCFSDNKRGELEQEAIDLNRKQKNELKREWCGFDTIKEAKAFREEKIAQKLYKNLLTNA